MFIMCQDQTVSFKLISLYMSFPESYNMNNTYVNGRYCHFNKVKKERTKKKQKKKKKKKKNNQFSGQNVVSQMRERVKKKGKW